MTVFGKKLKQLREQKRLSINQLALSAGVSAATISRIENGHRGVPKPTTIRKLADALNISYEQLMEIAGYMTIDKVHEPSEQYQTMNDIVAKYQTENLWLFDPSKWELLSNKDILTLEQYFKFLVSEAEKR
ncbi:helix-turn-helix transcriptional regulator [Bacillus sp. CLL-7-23]|uniref:Helix-turn-helix transcriptional regulator n=1 Tax=Bacillus changyiensis TaxID=3004103 RepID=A0ABT4X567_9BACI|nr:helix-turn-helix transcriptional regulator [Bacillus changyiensis]MDA7027399.1 helix-turn-helix transcriptional regulator [Bacillus changyiensis]